MSWENIIKYDPEEALSQQDRNKETNDYIKKVLKMVARGMMSVDNGFMLIQNKLDEHHGVD